MKRKTQGKRLVGIDEIIGQCERLHEWTAAHFVEFVGRNPLDRIAHASAIEDIVLRVGRPARVAGLVQRSLDEQIADLVARCGAADRVTPLNYQHLAAGSRQNGGRSQASKAGANDHGVIVRH